ncbi:SET domain protein 16 isoform 1 [Hibiscus syriacus]|uniref:SET domain protein 16 isoform 1 n=1 Tax=Hibiscus syriacus TaxID=106335 RepID=A0A6A2W7Z8_HIBSY|nr:SET domain protein 16 isoform 1 [Hibiscus syriacus]
MDFLCSDDFKNTKVDPQWTGFDYLLKAVEVDQEKAAKKRSPIDNAGESMGKKRERPRRSREEHGRKKRRATVLVPPCSPPLLPQSFMQRVEEMGGGNLVFVIEKKLFFSDVNPQASRLSIPFSQVQSHVFLTESEAQHLEGKNNTITALLLEPSMVKTEVNFRKWMMGKSPMYVIKTAWNSIVKNNGLKDTTVVRLWSFRADSTLCFALQRL